MNEEQFKIFCSYLQVFIDILSYILNTLIAVAITLFLILIFK